MYKRQPVDTTVASATAPKVKVGTTELDLAKSNLNHEKSMASASTLGMYVDTSGVNLSLIHIFAAEARELGIKPGDVKSTEEVEAMIEAKKVEEAKPKTEAERLELTRKKALNKLDFYERVVRSVAREEAEVAGYYEIMGEEKARPSIMDEQNQACLLYTSRCV